MPPPRRRESEANEFAREILMPEILVTRLISEVGIDLPLLAERFDVSVPALRLRLLLLDLLPAWMRAL
jgi:Zn-dependent peptidase ImmA (M78 family)